MKNFNNLILLSIIMVAILLSPQKAWGQGGRLSAMLVAVNEYCDELILKVPEHERQYEAPNGFRRIEPDNCSKFNEDLDKRYYLYNAIPSMKRALEHLRIKSKREWGPVIEMSEYSVVEEVKDGEALKRVEATGSETVTIGGKSAQRIPTKLNIQTMIDGLKAALKFSDPSENDLFVFYFTGHGILRDMGSIFPDLLTHGATSAADGATAISIKEDLIDEVKKFGFKDANGHSKGQTIIILDMCRNESQKDYSLEDREEMEKTLQKLNMADDKIQILFSTQEGKFSEVDTKHQIGFFTKFLSLALQGLADGFMEYGSGNQGNRVTNGINKDGTLTVKEVKGYIHHHLMKQGKDKMIPALFPKIDFEGTEDKGILYKSEDNPGVIKFGFKVFSHNSSRVYEMGYLTRQIENFLGTQTKVIKGDVAFAMSIDLPRLSKEIIFGIFDSYEKGPENIDALEREKVFQELKEKSLAHNLDYFLLFREIPHGTDALKLQWLIINPTSSQDYQKFSEVESHSEMSDWVLMKDLWWEKLSKDLEDLKSPLPLEEWKMERVRTLNAECFKIPAASEKSFDKVAFRNVPSEELRTEERVEQNIFIFGRLLPQAIKEGVDNLINPEVSPEPMNVPTKIDGFDPSTSKVLCFTVNQSPEFYDFTKDSLYRNDPKQEKLSYHLGGEISTSKGQDGKISIKVSPIINGQKNLETFSYNVPVVPSNSQTSWVNLAGKEIAIQVLKNWETIKKKVKDCRFAIEFKNECDFIISPLYTPLPSGEKSKMESQNFQKESRNFIFR